MQESAPGPGSGGNVIAALASLILPGLGQLAQGRILSALLQLVFSGVLWLISFGWLGWLGHLLAALDAALWRGPGGETYRRIGVSAYRRRKQPVSVRRRLGD
jgi:TM2 domain-containing membrane protein YozV